MSVKFNNITKEIKDLLDVWEFKLVTLTDGVISEKRNSQNRSIKQIVGHMIDSASNNTHRIVHLQYQESPLIFPNYATGGNNDRWIAIQNYQAEDWNNMVQLWKFIHLHIIYVIQNINEDKLKNQWEAGSDRLISLEEMVVDFPRHFKLHLNEIEELL